MTIITVAEDLSISIIIILGGIIATIHLILSTNDATQLMRDNYSLTWLPTMHQDISIESRTHLKQKKITTWLP